MARPIVAYLVVVTIGTWLAYAVADVQQGGDLVRAPLVATTALLGVGAVLLAFLAVLLIPALLLTIELVHRLAGTSRLTRSVLGAASWGGWCLFVAITLAIAGGVVLVPETLAGDLLLFAAAGAGFSLLAFDGHETRPGTALTLLALTVTALVILGSIVTAGRWGSPA